MREPAIVAAFLVVLFTGCAAHIATESTRPEEATAYTVTESTRPEEPTAYTSTGSTQAQKTTTANTTAAASEKKTTPPVTVAPATQEASAIGDSVMKGAVGTLQQEIPTLGVIDVQGSLQAPAAIGILRQRRAAGQLGNVVVVHIGNNGPFSAEMFDEMMQVLADVDKVLVVNVTVPPGVNDPIAVPNDAVLAEGVRRYPNTVLVDWRTVCAEHPEFVEWDGIHLTAQGAQAYADLIATHLSDS